MLRPIGGTLAGIAAWVILVTAINRGMRYGWHEYAAVEYAMTFTLPMMFARLSMSAVASLASGFVAGLIDRGSDRAPLIAGTIFFLLFLPEHYTLWHRFPIWYHVTYLLSLPLLSVLGGRLVPAKPAIA